MSTIKYALATSTLLAIASAAGLLATYYHLDYSPGELIDYSERRLQGHPKLEFIALPIIAVARAWLDAPSPKERMKNIFRVPPPPPLARAQTTASAPILDVNPSGHVLRVGPEGSVQTIAQAARTARDGDIVEIEAGEYHADVALWKQKKLTIRGIGGSARLFADGASAEGKAIWVIRNGDFVIENIDFIGARVHDKNGAGIRFENGHLKIKNCLFWANQNGILTASDETTKKARIEIEESEFGYNGIGDGLSHNLYVGKIAFLRVTGSYFHHANVGHLLKSRAAENQILYNRLTDESGGRASYELDFPNGGEAIVIGNFIQQSPETENSTMISYGREGLAWQKNELILASNTIVNDLRYGGAFLRTGNSVSLVVSANNLLIGKGKYHTPNILDSTNDINGNWDLFEQASRYDYRLSPKGKRLKYRIIENAILSDKLTPQSFYLHPTGVSQIRERVRYPGALQ